ncbi:M4 family metallopeptidase [Actinomycetospora sp.]|jgi:Zn-dependent metalloprotease|uniref:M4 family metallopeptidase n=1 Tax=Actinomycetospora sp. TaxID=1872135 RepID=UPI002F414424
MTNKRPCNCILPPQILENLLQSDDREIREAALSSLLESSRLRGTRSTLASIAGAGGLLGNGRRTVFDAQHRRRLEQATTARSEDDLSVADASVNAAFDGLGATRDFYLNVLKRDSIDGKGMRLNGYVHYGTAFNNAFWDGQEMVFGDGDGRLFSDFTGSLDVIAHELTHGVTEHTAALEYHNQSGALNESVSDVFGSVVKQWRLGETAAQADWLIGADIFTPGVGADALRSMKAPGTAYNSPLLGKDPQPARMSDYVQLPDTERGDFGGVHTNSGIPNKAFFLVATGIGGNSWGAPAAIWYEALKASSATTTFQAFADTTYAKAGQLCGANSAEQQAVLAGWAGVEITITGVSPFAARSNGAAVSGNGTGSAALASRVDELTTQIKALTKEVNALKKVRV